MRRATAFLSGVVNTKMKLKASRTFSSEDLVWQLPVVFRVVSEATHETTTGMALLRAVRAPLGKDRRLVSLQQLSSPPRRCL